MKLSVKEIKEIFKPKLLPIIWKNDTLTILDQSLLPFQQVYVDLKDVDSVARAIKTMQVRGAPAIGITAGYGMVISLLNKKPSNLDEAIKEL
ncbi:S-methyl-5-thioribose-1-phosphate isomerase, partial [Sulfolobus sp. F3]